MVAAAVRILGTILLLSSSSLAQEDACTKASPDWPDCLPNPLNGTYYVRAEDLQVPTCPREPCLTVHELITTYFTYSNVSGGYEAALSGNTSLLFLPGSHSLNESIYFYTSSRHSLTIAGLDDTCSVGALAVDFSCDKDTNIRLEDFGVVSLGCLNLYSCLLVSHSSTFFSSDRVFLHGGYLRANITTVSYTNMMVGPVVQKNQNGQLRMRFCNSGRVSNIIFAHNDQPDGTSNGVLHVHDSYNIGISNCTLYDNSNPLESRGVIHLHGAHNITLSEFHVYDNQKQGIYAIDSSFRFSGNNRFINNTGYDGGAIALFHSYLTVSSNANLLFERNHANDVGGGIFSSITNGPLFGGGTCAMTIDSSDVESLPQIVFINNTAVGSGSAMYGITMSQLLCDFTEGGGALTPIEAVPKIFNITPDDASAVSSGPERVCFCPEAGIPDCLQILPEHHPSLNYSVYPGQTFNVSARVVGPNFATAGGSVYSRFFNHTQYPVSLLSSTVQEVGTGCTTLQYSVRSRGEFVTISFTTDGREYVTPAVDRRITAQNSNNLLGYYNNRYSNNPDRYYCNETFRTDRIDSLFELAGNVIHSLQTAPVFISVTLLDCPPGFVLSSGNYAECKCDPALLENNFTCNIDDQSVSRYGTTWINATFDGNETGVIVYLRCPFDYCIVEANNVNLSEPDTQCAFNRSGTLCGACRPGLSVALGSPQCLKCTNNHIALLILFLIAGFALVLLIRVLNLTVAEGTINGLIFYANIIKANETILFPAVHLRVFLYIFISWFNLDFGIETCFFDGLDGYVKTWLQFAFPFYVWFLAILIIVTSHYSRRVTKVFGNNSVPMLATLFLLSFAKILQAIINVFSFSVLRYPNGSSKTVWSFDGNIPYITSQHGSLFFFALAVVLLLYVPYIGTLLSARWLRKYTHRRALKWLGPFFDAYFGPFKDKHYYWVGVLLVVRIILYTFFTVWLNVRSNVNILLIGVTSAGLLYVSLFARFYKKLYLTLLENSFFLNLAVLAIGTLYNNSVAGGHQRALVGTSLSIVAVQFIGIVIFHVYCFVFPVFKRKYKDYKLSQVRAKKTTSSFQNMYDPVVVYTTTMQDVTINNEGTDLSDQSLQLAPPQANATPLLTINFTELREPLLESS